MQAQFSLSEDVGPITVSIELQNDGGLGALRLDPSATTPALQGCVEAVSMVSCTWDGEVVDSPQTLAVFVDVDEAAPPNTGWNLGAIVGSNTTSPQNLANTDVFIAPPPGTTTLSGTVITSGGAPVENACIFVLTSPSFVYMAITDATGAWILTGLPDSYEFVVASIGPFAGEGGPCNTNGPPPVPEPGELQPVFFEDIWIDLSDPELMSGDPFSFAVSRGATVFADSTVGVVSCLSTAAGDVVPRPACIEAVPTTTTTAPGGGMAPTGLTSGPVIAAGALCLLLGIAITAAARRMANDQ